MKVNTMSYGVLAVIVQLLTACSGPLPDQNASKTSAPTTASATVPANALQIVVFGDSLYAGYNLDPGQGFAPALERALKAEGFSAVVRNAGVSGDTSAAGLQRIAFTLDGLKQKPDLVLVGLGGNDMLRGLSPDQTCSNLDAILAELKKRGLKTMLTGMVASPNMGPDYARAFNPIYPDLARKYGIALYPFFLDGVATDAALKLPDGIHPNAKGIDVIVRKVTPVVVGEIAD